METKKVYNRSSLLGSRSIRPSFYEILNQIKVQVEVYNFPLRQLEGANELCLIITEVMKLKPENEIKIDGTMLSVEMVQEVFSLLKNEHLQFVLDNFEKVNHQINNKKAYLRTALYNSVFEIESHYTNSFNTSTE